LGYPGFLNFEKQKFFFWVLSPQFFGTGANAPFYPLGRFSKNKVCPQSF
jgi:hypothetical protein